MECPSCHKPVDGTEKFCKNCGGPVPTAVSETDPLLGQILGGKFRIVKLLGEGGMGAVYEGEQQLGTKARKVAIKTLHKHLSTDPKILQRFQRECGTIAELEHPNTIQVFDFGTTPPPDNQLYIVMEYVSGRSLADVLEKDGPMDPKRVDTIMRQVCGSLEEAHGRGIVHRDLKPDNIVLTKRAGQTDFGKVLDFGIAKRGGDEDKNEQKLTQQGMVLGTPPYMSPEQFTGNLVDARSDVYALGVMGYEMLTGKLPWTAETPWEWATQHMTVQPYPIEGLPEAMSAPDYMRRAIMRAMAKNPDERFATVKDFYEAFGNPSGGGTQALAATAVAGAAGGPPSRVTVQTNPGEAVSQRAPTAATPMAMMNPMGERGAALGAVQPADARAHAQGYAQPQGAPMQGPPGMHTPMVAAASSRTGSGGGAGKAIGLGIGGLVLVAAIGGGLYFGFGRGKSGAGSGGASSDASTLTDTADASTTSAGSDDAAPLPELDAGVTKTPRDAGRYVHPDAGRAVTVVDAGKGNYISACGYAEQMRKVGNKAECLKLGAQCQAAGNPMPNCN